MAKAKRLATRKKRAYVLNRPVARELYREVVPRLQHFASEILHQLTYLIDAAHVDLAFPIQHRVKSFESAAAKLERRRDPPGGLIDLPDLVGLRLVLLFRRDVATVCDLVASTFRVIERQDASERLREDQFGYSSFHFVVRAPESWLSVPTLAVCANLNAEIQIRTTAQHVWAAASHVLQYKNEESVPVPVRRAIHRVSALLETVDLEFERVLAERDAYRSHASAEPSETLNVDLLERILDEIWPPENKLLGNEGYASLLEELTELGITTRQALVDAIKPWREQQIEADRQAVVRHREAGDQSERLQRGVYYVHTGLTRGALYQQFGEKWHEALERVFSRRPETQNA